MVHHGMKQIFGSADNYDTPAVDFTAWAGSMGITAYTIRQGGEINSALIDSLLESGGPALLDIRIDREQRIRGGGRVEALQHMSILHQKVEETSL
jgi:thiamine pyrophosphate-dependent acetolactate synthase large subunit-like protein